MYALSTTSLSAVDLINFSQGIAQLNLGYLGIAVAILGVLGGVFVYFNIKPLKESLDKQEKAIDEVKKEAQGLLVKSSEQSKKMLEDFKVDQLEVIDNRFLEQGKSSKLEISSRIEEVEKKLLADINTISDKKDANLKELILSETTNRLSKLEKEVIQKITSDKEAATTEQTKANTEISKLKSTLKEIYEKVKELQVYKYSKEGQMGAIIISIDLLKTAITDFQKLEKVIKVDAKKEFAKDFGWKIEERIDGLIKEIGDFLLDQTYIDEIKELLKKISGEEHFKPLIVKLESKLKSS